MKAESMNGWKVSSSLSNTGTTITLVAAKDDHESKETVVMNFNPEEWNKLSSLVREMELTANERRKAIKKANAAARPAEASPDKPHPG